jgi:peptidoglycan-associated lipoprotein
MSRQSLSTAFGILAIAALLLGPACATKGMVLREIATVDQKVESVSESVEENQQRLQEHDQKLASIGSLIQQHDSQFQAVDGRIAEVRRMAEGKLLFKETIRNDQAKFGFDSADLAPEVQATLDAFVANLIAENRGVYLEIQGHTDATGPEAWNLALGKKRADAVLAYLYKQHHVPLHRMEVFSYGSSAPVADNGTRDGRAMNRRVEILVYE